MFHFGKFFSSFFFFFFQGTLFQSNEINLPPLAFYTFSDRNVHPVAEFANAIGKSMPPVLDRVLDAFTSSRSGSYKSLGNSGSHSSLPALGKRDRSWSSNLGERPKTMSHSGSDFGGGNGGGRRQSAVSVGALTRADVDELAKLIGDSGKDVLDGEQKKLEQQEEGIVFGDGV